MSPLRWFGLSWGAPICEPQYHTSTPIGVPCHVCGTPMAKDAQGCVLPFAGDDLPIYVIHIDCFLDSLPLNAPT